MKNAAALSKAYAAYLSRTIEQVDQLTLHLNHEWEEAGGAALEEFRQKGLVSGKHSISITIHDRNGQTISSTSPFSRNLSVKDRHYFQFHQAHLSDSLLIGAPIVGRITGKVIVPITRRLSAPDGTFKGVVMVGVDPEFFFLPAGDILLGEAGMLSMARADGVFHLARLGSKNTHPDVSALLKVPMDNAPMLLEGKQWFSDGRSRYVASQTLDSYPYVAIVGLSQEEVLAPYEQMRLRYQAIAIAISILLTIFTGIATYLSVRLALKNARIKGVNNTYRLATEGGNEGYYTWEAVRDNSGNVINFRVVDCNERGANILGMTREVLVNKKLSDLAKPEDYFQIRLAQYRSALESGFQEDELELPGNGMTTADWIYRRLVRSGDGLAMTIRDISDQKRHQEELTRAATHDTLTGLPNMYWLATNLPNALERAASKHRQMAILFLDIDDFKDVNDALGHSVGNRLLQEIGTRLLSLLRPGDRLVRRAGGAFAIVLDSIAGRDEATDAAQCVMLAIQKPFDCIKRRKAVTVSSGIAIFPDDGCDAETLLKNADIAMYAAKAECRGKFRFYEQSLFERIRYRLEMEQEMLRAISERHFIVHYQPRVNTRTGQLVGMEALVRWAHPERGLVPPNEFISLAEANGLIITLGEQIMQIVCAELAAWREQGHRVVPVSVNVSARQFDEGNVKELVSKCLTEYHIPPSLLEIELTESAMMGDFEIVQREVDAITALGIKIHVDDFGTGYSSLSLLHKLNMNVLKIDRTFTSQLGNGRDGHVFFTAIVSMARELGMSVVAEGVETEEQLRVLQQLGCDEIQGYFVSKPLPACDMPALMNRRILLSNSHQIA